MSLTIGDRVVLHGVKVVGVQAFGTVIGFSGTSHAWVAVWPRENRKLMHLDDLEPIGPELARMWKPNR
jgi:hypothetical protein